MQPERSKKSVILVTTIVAASVLVVSMAGVSVPGDDGPAGLSFASVGEETGTYKQPYTFDEYGLEGTWYCHQAQVYGHDAPLFGDPAHFSLCEQWRTPDVVCYIVWLAGEWDGTFQCIHY